MKRFLVCILVVVLSIGFAGCSFSANSSVSSVEFYYLNNTATFHSQNGSTAPEARKLPGNNDTLESVLNLYLAGPESQSLTSPFPENVKALSVVKDRRIVKIVLSSEFLALRDLDLTLACTCIARTVFFLTGYSNVEISAKDPFYDGRTSILMSKDLLLLYDGTT